jgi:hypothetical protein
LEHATPIHDVGLLALAVLFDDGFGAIAKDVLDHVCGSRRAQPPDVASNFAVIASTGSEGRATQPRRSAMVLSSSR